MSPQFRRLGLLAVVVVLGASCGSAGDKSGTSAPAPKGSSTASASREAGHAHGTKTEGGLTIGEPMPARDDPNHPPDVTTQEIFKMGEQAVFSIEGRRPDDLTSSGTGFLVDKAGQHAVTNAHVVEGLAAITGRFNDGTRAALHVIASDPCSDLAVVHFSDALPSTVKELVIGSSEKVQPGDTVTTLGYPGTLAGSSEEQKLLITSGLVNGTKVEAKSAGMPTFKDTIQHSATLNPGNSGGPLIDHHGRVVGINTLKNADADGQYYSIAIDTARAVLTNKLLKGESQNNLGWSVEEYAPGGFTAVDPELGPALDKQLAAKGITGGLYVRSVTAGTGASKAKIEPGMMIRRIQNTSSGTIADMCAIVESLLPGSVAEVEGIYLLSDPKRFTTEFKAEFTVPGKH